MVSIIQGTKIGIIIDNNKEMDIFFSIKQKSADLMTKSADFTIVGNRITSRREHYPH